MSRRDEAPTSPRHDLQDLLAAFHALEEEAPSALSPERLPPRRQGPSGERPGHGRAIPRRRVLVPLVMAGAAAATAIAWGAVPGAGPGHRQVEAEGRGLVTRQQPTALHFSFQTGQVDGFTIRPAQVQPGLQRADIMAGGPDTLQIVGAIYVFDRGQFDSGGVRRPTRVQVQGRPGMFGKTPSPSLLDQKTAEPAVLDSVAWPYLDDAWALVQLNSTSPALPRVDVKDAELRIAAVVRTGRPAVLRAPFTLGYLPTGVYPLEANQNTDPLGMIVGLGDGRPGDAQDPHPPIPGDPFSAPLRIWVTAYRDTRNALCPPPGPEARPVIVNGQTGCLLLDPATGQTYGLQLNLVRGHLEIGLDERHRGIYSDKQLLRIASSVTPAPDPADMATWYDARTILPPH